MRVRKFSIPQTSLGGGQTILMVSLNVSEALALETRLSGRAIDPNDSRIVAFQQVLEQFTSEESEYARRLKSRERPRGGDGELPT